MGGGPVKVYVLKKVYAHGGPVKNLGVYVTQEEAIYEGERVIREDGKSRADAYEIEAWDVGEPAYSKWRPDCVWVDDREYEETPGNTV